ncbi:ATP-binding protein [Streptomyces sp. NPDC059894]|uniref:ATP-binding protein n=1 Tax=unclassified Streptomyces TaxID=2593676 RepID=UPI00364802ED
MGPGALGEGPAATGDDSLHVTAALEGGGACIAAGRDLAADFLTRARAVHGVPVTARTVDLTQLVVSELVTNARKYAPGPVLLEVRVAEGTVEVNVWDSDPVLPVARPADPDRVGQHGLEIVLAVVSEFDARREPVGKCVTARIALAEDPAPVGGARADRPR